MTTILIIVLIILKLFVPIRKYPRLVRLDLKLAKQKKIVIKKLNLFLALFKTSANKKSV
jgi:hypothetical protein